MGIQRQRGSKHGYPESAHIVREYATLKNVAQAFAAGKIKLLILLGGPGKGKGKIVKRAMQAQAPTHDDEFIQALSQSLENILAHLAPAAVPQPHPPNLGPGWYFKGYISPISLHIGAYKHRDAPVCIDDADAFFADAQLRERTKHLSETGDNLPGVHYPQRVGLNRPYQSGHRIQGNSHRIRADLGRRCRCSVNPIFGW